MEKAKINVKDNVIRCNSCGRVENSSAFDAESFEVFGGVDVRGKSIDDLRGVDITEGQIIRCKHCGAEQDFSNAAEHVWYA